MIAKFFKTSSTYAIGNSLNALLAFFLIPLYLNNLTIQEYGVYGLLMIIIKAVSRFGNMGFETSMIRSYYDYESSYDKGRVLSTSLILMLASLSIISFILILLTDKLGSFLFNSSSYTILIIMAVGIGSFRALRKIPQGVLRIHEKSKLYITLEVINFSLGCSLLIYLIQFEGLGINGLILGTLISSAFNVLCFFGFTIKYFRFGIIPSEVYKQLKFGVPLLPSSASAMVLSSTGKFFLQKFHGLELVGIFTLATQLSGMIETFLGQGIKLAWKPFLMKNFKKPNFKSIVELISNLGVILTILTGTGMVIFAEPLLILFSKDNYNMVLSYLPYLILIQSFWCLIPLYNSGVIITRRTGFIAINFGFGAILMITLSLLLTKSFALNGIIIATSITYISMFLSLIRFNHKIGYNYLSNKHWVLYLFGIPFMLISQYLFQDNTSITSIFLRIIYLAALPVSIKIIGHFMKYNFFIIKKEKTI